MNNRLMIQRLWWKELRQLVPMLVLLPTIAALLTLLYLTTSNSNQSTWFAGVVVFLGMPGLFAVGAGALLVGQEKESRTIQWLTSLPILPATIVRIKTAAAVVGLLVLWIISGMYFGLIKSLDPLAGTVEQFWVWPANSFFILFAGIALAWKNKSALVALLLVVPIAVVPYVLAVMVHRMLGIDGRTSMDPSEATVVTVQLICSAVALFAADRIGCRALLPERVRNRSSDSSDVSQGKQREEMVSADYGVTQSALPALIWQFAMQSRALLVGTALMMICASVLFLARADSRPGPGGFFITLLTYLATSWLGASVFQSDSAHQRIRFLADRGISPKLVWLTRHAVPIAIIATITIATLLLAIVIEPLKLRASPSFGAMSMLALVALFVVYSFSQWVGQVITSPIVSMITAPLVSIIPFAMYSFAVTTLSAPLPLFAVAAILPFLATFLSTRRWMDRRFGARYWFIQAGYAATIFLLPALPHIVALVREPGMSRQVRSQMDVVAANSQGYSQPVLELVANKEGENEKSFDSFEKVWNEQLDSIELQLGATSQPVGVSSQRVVRKIFSINLLVRLSLDQSDSTLTTEYRELYGRSLAMLSDIVVRMRTSPQVIDQDFADSIEIAMVRQMRREGVRGVLGEERYRLIATRLADASSRREARIRSVSLSWNNYEQIALRSRNHTPCELGGYDLQGGGDGWAWRNGKTLMNRRAARRAQHLWQLASVKGGEVPRELLHTVARDWGRPPTEYGLGSIGNHYRVDDVDDSVGSILTVSKSVANQWYAGWEDQARELVNEP